MNSKPAILHKNLTLIEVNEPALLREIIANRRLGPLVATTLSETIAAVRPENSGILIERLKAAGYFPRVLNQKG